ncbi:MAG: glycosyltransferase family 4 protein [Oscillatoriales cyanobacterium SM2_1_8]|nr:glycosyltransferase family 4 protein [Oscillatoriales cyanobacterium SM2_1_8]
MRVAFVDRIGWDYRPDTVYREPLGGSQSAVCYLTAALAQRGVTVALVNHTTQEGEVLGVSCHHAERLPERFWQNFDAVVLFNESGLGLVLREALMEASAPHPGPQLILWTQHDTNQPAMQALHDRLERTVYDRFVLVSEWQRQQYLQVFGLESARTQVLRNAIAPSLERLPAIGEKEPLVVYTSTPFRGLAELLSLWPAIHRDFPQARLEVFSSLKVYRQSEAEDRAYFGELYDRCQQLPGVAYRGSIPQPELAQVLQRALILAYPNTFPETSCIAVLEALAAGCHVVTSALGALPETTGGWATLIAPGPTYGAQFVAAVGQILREAEAGRPHRDRQSAQTKADHTWARRAAQWEAWLREVCQPEALPEEEEERAQAHERRLQFEAAAAIREERYERCPEDWANIYALARDYRAAGYGWSESWPYLQEAMVAAPTNPEILWQMALAWEAIGDPETAERYWQEAIALCPGLAVLRGAQN